jgi:hypothetical protein
VTAASLGELIALVVTLRSGADPNPDVFDPVLERELYEELVCRMGDVGNSVELDPEHVEAQLFA